MKTAPAIIIALLIVAGCRIGTKEPVVEYGMYSKPGAHARWDTVLTEAPDTMPANARRWWANHSAARKERRADLRSSSTRPASAADSATAAIHEAESRRLAPNIWARRDEARRRFKEADEWLKAHGYDEGGKPNHSEAPKTPAAKRTMTWYACEGDTAYLHDIPAGIDSLVVKFVPCGDDQEQPLAAAKVAAVMEANGITLPQVAAYLDAYGFDVVGRAATLRPHWSPAPPGRDAQGNTVPVAYYIANIRIAVGDTTLAIYAPQAVGPVWMRVKAYDGRGMSSTWSATEVSGPGALLPGVAE